MGTEWAQTQNCRVGVKAWNIAVFAKPVLRAQSVPLLGMPHMPNHLTLAL